MIAIAHTPATLSLATALAEELTNVTLFASGFAMEDAVRNRGVRAVIDLAIEEMLPPRCVSASKTSSEAEAQRGDRLTAAAIAGVPQLVVITHFEGTAEALDALGKEIAEKACAARGPTLVLAADAPHVLVQSLANWIYPPSLLEEITVEQLLSRILRFIRG